MGETVNTAVHIQIGRIELADIFVIVATIKSFWLEMKDDSLKNILFM